MALREEKHAAILEANNSNKSDDERELELQMLFDRVDSNHNGQIDVGEFRAAMQMIGEQLSG